MRKRVTKIISLIFALVFLLSFSLLPVSAASNYSCVFDFHEPVPSHNANYLVVAYDSTNYVMVCLFHEGNSNARWDVVADNGGVDFNFINWSTVTVYAYLYTVDLNGNVTYGIGKAVSPNSTASVSSNNWAGRVKALTSYGVSLTNTIGFPLIDCHFSDCAYLYDILVAANSINSNIGIVRDNIVAINSELDLVRANQSTVNSNLSNIYSRLGTMLSQFNSNTTTITNSITTGVDTIVGESKTYESVNSSSLDEYGCLQSDLPSVNGSDLEATIDTDLYFTTYSGGFEFWKEKFEGLFGHRPELMAVLLFSLSIGLGTFIIGRRV